MTAEQLLTELDALGISVRQSGPDRLTLAPADRIPAGLVPELKAAKSQLLALIAARTSTTWSGSAPAGRGDRSFDDPRPDLSDDSAAWSRLLELLSATGAKEFFGVMLGIRCCGARLVHDGHWRLEPLIDPTERLSAWQDRLSWERDRYKWLIPHRAEVTALLKALPEPETIA